MQETSTSAPASAEEPAYYHNEVFGSRILVRILRKSLGQRVLEVGAGVGHITEQLARHAREIVALEPNKVLFEQLRQRTRGLANVTTLNMTLDEYVKAQDTAAAISPAEFDSIIYVNVLEHIHDDVEELAQVRELLGPGGHALIIVPAHQWLYAKVDRLTGHHRRYSRRSLHHTITTAGLQTRSIRFFDTVGLIPYLVIYKWLRSTATSGTNATLYSRVVLPLSLAFFHVSHGFLIGKNLVGIATLGKSSHN